MKSATPSLSEFRRQIRLLTPAALATLAADIRNVSRRMARRNENTTTLSEMASAVAKEISSR